jgi:ABC-type phosphate transport system ATPase subunit
MKPASALDPISTAKIEELIYELKKRLYNCDRNTQYAAGRKGLVIILPSSIWVNWLSTTTQKKIFTNPKDIRTPELHYWPIWLIKIKT